MSDILKKIDSDIRQLENYITQIRPKVNLDSPAELAAFTKTNMYIYNCGVVATDFQLTLDSAVVLLGQEYASLAEAGKECCEDGERAKAWLYIVGRKLDDIANKEKNKENDSSHSLETVACTSSNLL